jgi:hypothetical protein
MKYLVRFLPPVVGCLILIMSGIVVPEPAVTSAAGPSGPPVSDQPPDTGRYNRKLIPQDNFALPLAPRIRVRDVVVSNTDSNLINEMVSDTGPSIAIDPTITDQIVITAFSGSWGTNAPIWYSGDGGITWTKKFSIPAPPNIPSALGCPCDQTVDYGRGSLMFGTFLTASPPTMPGTTTDVYSASTIKPLKPAFWNWLLSGGVAQRTNSFGVGNSDQPWLLVDPNPSILTQDNVYVAYDDFVGLTVRVAVAQGANPPTFSVDQQAGSATCCVNPGHRLAVNSNNGYIYSIFQQYN